MKKPIRSSALCVLGILTAGSTLLAGCSTQEATPSSSNLKQNKQKLTIKMMSSLQTEPPDMNSAFWTGLEEKTNTHLEIDWVPINDYVNKVNIVLASGNLPDVVTVTEVTDPNVVDAINKGMFWELGELLGDFSKYPNLKNNVPESAWKLMRHNGKIFGLPRTRPPINSVEMIRKDLLDKLGLPMPKTMDELLVSLKKIIDSDPSGTGKKDTIGLEFAEDFRMAFGGAVPEFTADGGLYPKELTDAYTSMVDWYRKAYSQGLMSQEFAVMKDSQYYSMFESGLAVFYRKNAWHQYRLEQGAKKVQPGALVEYLPYLTGPNGSTAILTPGFYGGQFIPKSVPKEKAERILQYYELVASSDITDYITYGTEGVHHKKENGAIVMTDQGKKEINNTTIEPFVLKLNPWSKTDSPLAPNEVNLKNREKIKPVQAVAKIDPYTVINSPTWVTQWPKYQGEFTTMRTQAIIGKISMEQYKTFIDQLRAKKEFNQSFKEFGDNYKALFGK